MDKKQPSSNIRYEALSQPFSVRRPNISCTWSASPPTRLITQCDGWRREPAIWYAIELQNHQRCYFPLAVAGRIRCYVVNEHHRDLARLGYCLQSLIPALLSFATPVSLGPHLGPHLEIVDRGNAWSLTRLPCYTNLRN